MIEHRHEIPRVNQTFPMVGSVFSKINYDFTMDSGQLDLLFYTDYGFRSIAPLVVSVKGDSELTSEKLVLLATMFFNKYHRKWDKYKEVLNADYDPLHNFLDEYHEEGSSTEDASNSLARSGSLTETTDTDNTLTRTDNLSEVDNGSFSSTESGSVDNERHGFNSATAVPTDSSDTSGSSGGTNSNTKLNTGTQTSRDVRDESRVSTDTRRDDETIDRDKTHERDGYHRGNIGNISSQKLLKEEIDLWKWNFVEEVLRDAADFFTLPIYRLFN